MRLDLQWWQGPDHNRTAELIIRSLPLVLEYRLELRTRASRKLIIDHNWALLHRVHVAPTHRHEGIGTDLMHQAVRTADGLRYTLVLRPLPFGGGSIMSAELLREWYGEFGFDFYHNDQDLMVRQWRR
jgi:GNAT superfamily N-acetyltransferase